MIGKKGVRYYSMNVIKRLVKAMVEELSEETGRVERINRWYIRIEGARIQVVVFFTGYSRALSHEL